MESGKSTAVDMILTNESSLSATAMMIPAWEDGRMSPALRGKTDSNTASETSGGSPCEVGL